MYLPENLHNFKTGVGILSEDCLRENIFLWIGRIGGCSRRGWVGLCIRGYVGRIGGWVGGVSVGVGRRWGVVGVGRDGVGSWWGVSRDGVGRWRGVVVVVGGLGPTHLVTYVVVGAHVQLVHCASMLFHLWVLPATVYYSMHLKEQLLEILWDIPPRFWKFCNRYRLTNLLKKALTRGWHC